MGHYKSNLRDLQFNLFELLQLDKVLESGEFGDLDHETAVDMLREVKALAEGPIAESSPTPTATRRSSTRRTTASPSPRASRSPTTPSSKAAGTRSASPRSSAACPPRVRSTGPSAR